MKKFQFLLEGNPTMNKGIAYNGYYKEFYNNRNYHHYTHLLSYIISHSSPGRILDIGCGEGFFLELADKWGIPCDGIEGSEEAIQSCNLRIPHINVQKHLLSEQLPFSNSSFQTILINQVIEHLEPGIAQNTLAESYRILKKGGMIYITSPSKFNKDEIVADPTHINMYSPKELQNLVLSTGFINPIHINYSLNFLGNSFLGKKVANRVFRLLKCGQLSATANIIAFKV